MAERHSRISGLMRWIARVWGLPGFAVTSLFLYGILSDELFVPDTARPFSYYLSRLYFSMRAVGYLAAWKWELAGGIIILAGASLHHQYGEISQWSHWMTAGIGLMTGGWLLTRWFREAGGYVVYTGALVLIVAVWLNIGPNRGFWLNTSLPALLFIVSWILSGSRDMRREAGFPSGAGPSWKRRWYVMLPLAAAALAAGAILEWSN